MILSRNLTTLLSFYFALTSLALKAGPAQQKNLCPKPETGAEVSATAGYYLEQAKAAAAQSHWELAESCLALGQSLEPKNRDFAFYSARVKAWQGKHTEASDLIKSWPANDAESREIRGDLAWYRNDWSEAETWYRAGINQTAPVEAWKLWLKTLKAKKDRRYPAALDQARTRFPEDPDLRQWVAEKDDEVLHKAAIVKADSLGLKLKGIPTPQTIDKDRAAYRAALSGTRIRETQKQSLQAIDVDLAVIAQRKSLSLGASQVTRDFGPTSRSDKSYRLGLGRGFTHDHSAWIHSEETTLSGGGSPDPEFTPIRFYTIRHELFLADRSSVMGELAARWYRDIYVRMAMLGVAYGLESYRFTARVYNTQAKHNESSVYVSAAYQGLAISPEIFIRGGRDAASRPYLLGLENARFFALGTQVDYRFSKQWASRAVYEQRWENGFHQESLSLALLWYDR